MRGSSKAAALVHVFQILMGVLRSSSSNDSMVRLRKMPLPGITSPIAADDSQPVSWAAHSSGVSFDLSLVEVFAGTGGFLTTEL